ncbi:MAG TPA: Ldh family oxidoreductase [Acetobacteraceae bacterium]|jgi:LDH2 family malate/lactate/ureidoglycolate dehydrogenase
MSDRRVTVAALADFIAGALRAVELPPDDACSVAALMAEADARGSDGHGVFRLPQYIRRIKAGGINVRPNIRVVQERAATAVIDGDNAMGHLVMRRATELAIAKARQCGIGWVGARHSNHAGPAALYARMPLAHDMVGLYLAVGNANHLPPWGGTEMLLSTNPIAIAVPGRDRPPIVLDMATTNAAYGKVKVKAQRNEPMPEGWMVDRQGRSLTDAHRANEGFLLPIGGAKGYGLALMFGLLAGSLNGAAFGKDVVDFNADDRSVTNTGHAIMALDIAAFGAVDAFRDKVDETWSVMQASPTLPGFDAVRLPGEHAAQVYAERTAQGIPIPADLQRSLDTLAAGLGIASL